MSANAIIAIEGPSSVRSHSGVWKVPTAVQPQVHTTPADWWAFERCMSLWSKVSVVRPSIVNWQAVLVELECTLRRQVPLLLYARMAHVWLVPWKWILGIVAPVIACKEALLITHQVLLTL